MRVVGQQAAPRRRPLGHRCPGVRGPRHPRPRHGRERPPGERDRRPQGRDPRHQAGIVWQRGHALARVVRQQIRQPVVRQQQRHPRPQHLGLESTGQLQGHQLQDRNRIRRRPGRNLRLKQEELRRAPAPRTIVDLFDPGIHPGRIGLQRPRGRLVLHLGRLQREAVEIKAPHQLVDLDRRRAEDFRQPPLRRAPQHHHLPQPVLRMGEAQGVVHILVGLPEDMRHVVVVAHDLHRGGDAPDGEILVVIHQRSRQDVIGQHRRDDAQGDQPRDDPDQPAKGGQHWGPVPLGLSLTAGGGSVPSRCADEGQQAGGADGESGISWLGSHGVPYGGTFGRQGA